MAEGEEPLPYLGNAGFYAWHDIKPLNENEESEEKIPKELPFVPDYILDMDLDPELPPPTSRIKSRRIGGEMQLPESIRDDILATDQMNFNVEVGAERLDGEMGMREWMRSHCHQMSSLGGNLFPLP